MTHENLKGRVAVVTGGGGVLCGQFAKTLAKQGCKVAVLDLNEAAAQACADEIVANGGDVKVVNKTTGEEIMAKCELTDRTKAIIIAGGLLNYTKENS